MVGVITTGGAINGSQLGKLKTTGLDENKTVHFPS